MARFEQELLVVGAVRGGGWRRTTAKGLEQEPHRPVLGRVAQHGRRRNQQRQPEASACEIHVHRERRESTRVVFITPKDGLCIDWGRLSSAMGRVSANECRRPLSAACVPPERKPKRNNYSQLNQEGRGGQRKREKRDGGREEPKLPPSSWRR
ncbi:hypothetical protein CJ030_MR7G027964 [Morella rubra]|uniref:Uncharacterized protein n=1 Tax=Morella rubra TaxID=262757 RepID=A0A6A1UZT6_9ROSI|nr:hypothetical protein CJ030_MR7G027964 [Morella rubra]